MYTCSCNGLHLILGPESDLIWREIRIAPRCSQCDNNLNFTLLQVNSARTTLPQQHSSFVVCSQLTHPGEKKPVAWFFPLNLVHHHFVQHWWIDTSPINTTKRFHERSVRIKDPLLLLVEVCALLRHQPGWKLGRVASSSKLEDMEEYFGAHLSFSSRHSWRCAETRRCMIPPAAGGDSWARWNCCHEKERNWSGNTCLYFNTVFVLKHIAPDLTSNMFDTGPK